ncbi:MAG: dTMP kinase [Alphaproteobacteria bacterium]
MTSNLGKGPFISFEGGDGSGKTGLIERLYEALNRKGYRVHKTREPGGTPSAELIRPLILQGDVARWDSITEALLMFASRRDHVEKVIKPKTESGEIVLSDRFAESSRAYQGWAKGDNRTEVAMIQQAAIGSFKPDLTFILDVDVVRGLERANKRMNNLVEKEDRFENNGLEFHERVREAFLSFCDEEPDRCIRIDANGDQESVFRAVTAVLNHKFGWNL